MIVKNRLLPIIITMLLTTALFTGCINNRIKPVTDRPKGGIELDNYDLTLKESEEINRNCELGMQYLSLSPLSEEQAKQYGPDSPYLVNTDDQNATGYYFYYPYGSKNLRLTQIHISGGHYHFYGIKVGDDIDKARSVLEPMEYSQTANLYVYDGTATETYNKHDIHVTFETDSQSTAIRSILIATPDPNEPETIY